MTLLKQALTEGAMMHAWQQVRQKNASPGADGVSVSLFARDLSRNLEKLRKLALAGKYKPLPVLRCRIPKPDGDFRRIGIPSVSDRVLQRALLNRIMPLIDPKLASNSYAYRPKRSVAKCVVQIGYLHRLGLNWCARADIDLCFESIPQDKLLKQLWDFLPDSDCVKLVKNWLKAGVVDGPRFVPTTLGVQQGDVLSPVLCNIYLDQLDRMLISEKLQFVRYADDLLILCKTSKDAQKAMNSFDKALERLELARNPEKSEVVSFLGGFRYLGTIFVCSLALPVIREVRPDGKVRFHSGYESHAPRIKVEPNRNGRLVVSDDGVSDRLLARTLAAAVVRQRRGEETEIGKAILKAWNELKVEAKVTRTDWEDSGRWAVLDD